jgi:F-type H+-transporting ATPase subunit epsilon
MRVTVISPEESVFEGEATAVVAPAHDGEVGILPRHAPFMTLLGEGKLTVRQEGGTDTVLHVRGGLLQVLDDVVSVIAEHAEGEDDVS